MRSLVLVYIHELSPNALDRITSFCHDHALELKIRMFNSVKYRDDADYITSLPAFHIYEDGSYCATCTESTLESTLAGIRPTKRNKWWFSWFRRYTRIHG